MQELVDAVAKFDGDKESIWIKRSRHVVTENSRVASAVKALKKADWDTLGSLMNASHESLRHDFEVSSDELDMLVDITRNCTAGKVYGSRMTGGGFGGCTISLVEGGGKEKEIISAIQEEYKRKSGGVDCQPFVVNRPGGGVKNY